MIFTSLVILSFALFSVVCLFIYLGIKGHMDGLEAGILAGISLIVTALPLVATFECMVTETHVYHEPDGICQRTANSFD